MRERAISAQQREILEALAEQWELLLWRCLDGTLRWHLGKDEVDGRAVWGLRRRGLVERGGDYAGGQLVLTARGRAVLG